MMDAREQPDIVIVDIDGTISNVSKRVHHILHEPKDWDSFYEDCYMDEPIMPIIRMVKALSKSYYICFCTGRRESVREKTLAWIMKYFGSDFRFSFLLMRRDGDKRHDVEVKPELLCRAGIEVRNVEIILEDRKSMVKRWRELGFKCLQVEEGEY